MIQHPPRASRRAPRYLLGHHRRPAFVLSVAAGLVMIALSARADPYDQISAAANSTEGDSAALSAKWTAALTALDQVPANRRTFLHCYWRGVLLYRLNRPQDGNREGCVKDIVAARDGTPERKANAINGLTDQALDQNGKVTGVQVAALQSTLQASLGTLAVCQQNLAAAEGKVTVAHNEAFSLKQKLDGMSHNLQQLTQDPQIRTRIEQVSALKTAKSRIDVLGSSADSPR
jgi:hypothetical protein